MSATVTDLNEARQRIANERLVAEAREMNLRCQYLRRTRRDCPWLCDQTWTVMHGDSGSSVEAFYLANREGLWRPFAVVFLHRLMLAASDPEWSLSNAQVIVDRYAMPAFEQAGVRFRPGSLAA